jgi:mono/diheme cytochrome c family protein
MQDRRKRNRTLLVWSLVVWTSATVLSVGVAAQAPGNAPASPQTQIEKGRQVVGQACAACHTTIVRMMQVHSQTEEQWRDTVYFMISRGAQVMPDEIEPVVAYLTATAGKNRQTVTQAPGAGRGGPGRGGAQLQLPEGEGRAVFQGTCQQCHDAATASAKLPSEEWSAVITRMMSYGATLTSADQQKLITYLNGFGK